MKRKGILCKACQRKGGPCRYCGGYGVILQKEHCPKCQGVYWTKPGPYTTYEGKQWTSWDGREMVSHMESEPNCLTCEGKRG